ncbi:hypothetical protein ABPG72_002796 [Tetrahymena utriculariae]
MQFTYQGKKWNLKNSSYFIQKIQYNQQTKCQINYQSSQNIHIFNKETLLQHVSQQNAGYIDLITNFIFENAQFNKQQMYEHMQQIMSFNIICLKKFQVFKFLCFYQRQVDCSEGLFYDKLVKPQIEDQQIKIIQSGIKMKQVRKSISNLLDIDCTICQLYQIQ